MPGGWPLSSLFRCASAAAAARHLKRLRRHAQRLRRVYTALAEDAKRGEPSSPAAEWLLDNFHIVVAALRDIHHDLPAGVLPAPSTHRGRRVRRSAAHLRDGARTDSMQRRTPRSAAPASIRHGLSIDYSADHRRALGVAVRAEARARRAPARRRADVLATSRAHRLEADRLVDALDTPAHVRDRWPSQVHPAFVIRLLQRSREHETAASLRRELDAALASRGQTIEDAIRSEARHQAAEQAFMANLIGSLRLVSSFDWSEFFESVSLVEQVLQRDPVAVYGRMDFASRDRYRHAVEEMAEPTGDGQVRVALKSVERARQIAERTPDAAEAHIGYYLIGAGRQQFERGIGWEPGLRRSTRPGVLPVRHPGLSRDDRDRHAGAGRSGACLRGCPRLAMADAHARGPVDDRPDERADDPDSSALARPIHPATASPSSRSLTHSGIGADDGDRSDDPRQRRARGKSCRASRSAGARQS